MNQLQEQVEALFSTTNDEASRKLWRVTREAIAETPSAGQDALRLEAILARSTERPLWFANDADSRWIGVVARSTVGGRSVHQRCSWRLHL